MPRPSGYLDSLGLCKKLDTRKNTWEFPEILDNSEAKCCFDWVFVVKPTCCAHTGILRCHDAGDLLKPNHIICICIRTLP